MHLKIKNKFKSKISKISKISKLDKNGAFIERLKGKLHIQSGRNYRLI